MLAEKKIAPALSIPAITACALLIRTVYPMMGMRGAIGADSMAVAVLLLNEVTFRKNSQRCRCKMHKSR